MGMVLKRWVPFVVLGLMAATPLLTAAGHGGDDPAPPGSVEVNDWTGFIACGVGSPFLVSTAFCTYDENEDHEHTFTVQEGLKTLVVGMEWQSGSLGSDSLQIALGEDPQIHETGSSPIEFRLDEGEDFDPITGPKELTFQVLPPDELSVVYQQDFTVHHHEFYGGHAPADYSALPDG